MRDLKWFLLFYVRFLKGRFFLLLAVIALAAVLEGLGVGMILPILMGENLEPRFKDLLTNVLGAFGLPYDLIPLLGLMVGFSALRSATLIGESFLVGEIMRSLLVKLRLRAADGIFRLRFEAYTQKPSAYFTNVMNREFQNLITSFRNFANVLINLMFAAAYAVVPVLVNPALIPILIATVLPIVWIARKLTAYTKDNAIRTTHAYASLQRSLIEALSHFKYLKATHTSRILLDQFQSQSRSLAALQKRQEVLGAVSEYSFEPVIMLVLAGVVYYFVKVEGQSIVQNGVLLALFYRSVSKILGVQSAARKLLQGWGSLKNFEELETLLARESERSPTEHAQTPSGLPGEIQFENVSFSYGSGPPVLERVSFRIPDRAYVGFVGESGAGKTTLVNLVVGLQEPTEGEICFASIPQKQIPLNHLRSHIGYITQENVVFNDTLLNNVTLWDKDTPETRRRAEEALRRAHLSEFVASQPLGLNTQVGESGIMISGGQRQRLTIARELYRDPGLLIFDESTSSLDSKTEREIQSNIEEIRGTKTILVIAHRLSTVRNCDRIYVLKQGRIVEEGSYDELAARPDGEFRRMIEQQMTRQSDLSRV